MDCFTEIYDVPGFWVHFGTCTDSVYQALFLGLGMRLVQDIHVRDKDCVNGILIIKR